MSASVSGEDTSIREGFLCPICMQDLNSVYQLQVHFEENHSSEDKALLHHLKGFFGKAKRFLGKTGEPAAEVTQVEEDEGDRNTGSVTQTSSVSGIDDTQWAPQEIGAMRGHYQYFRGQRGSHIDRNTVETNKLLIRLEKLVKFNAECADPAKRKAFEKTVVPWKEDSSVKFCPFCLERFGLSLRRHHCRLCGNIACSKCSDFMPNTVCENLLKSEEEILRDYQRQQARKDEGADGREDEDMSGTLRVCKHCDQLLIMRLQAVRQKVIKPTIVLLYERLSEMENHIIAQLSVYNPKVESLLSGSSGLSRDVLERERTKILQNFDLSDTISKKILGLATSTSSSTQQRLYQKIRTHCTLFLQANMHTMVTLPTKEELQKLQQERRAAIARRIQEEKEAELEAQRQERLSQERREQRALENTKKGHVRIPSWPLNLNLNLNKSKQDTSPTKSSTGGGARTLEGGWKPSAMSEAELMASSDNPMVQQMNIIRNYIRQAREMQRADEVRMLEENLRELEMEYRRQSRF
ncbi:rabenosyn-5-like isoform X2 [Acanthaster planci]|uniref:Rabenosyn-5-like isoform X2 n=1 Tax=Acanthaster planci TaxID=133434 RepID=A0A8B7ZIA3_ACAPL|nr:rabenosyn-5-like isoform X2 [Acanthaster planci]